MKKKRRIWMFAIVFAIAAVQGTIFAESPELESSVEAVAETRAETTETGKALDTKIPMEKTSVKKSRTKQSKQAQDTVKKTDEGQTLLDVKQGNITITSTGATGGGV